MIRNKCKYRTTAPYCHVPSFDFRQKLRRNKFLKKVTNTIDFTSQASDRKTSNVPEQKIIGRRGKTKTTSKIEGVTFGRKKNLRFSTIHFVGNLRKNEGGTLWWGKNFRKKSCRMPKKIERGDPLVPPGNVCYAENRKNLFSLVPWANW